LDEELIGIQNREKKERLLDSIQPQFIILKPTLHGGLQGCDEWIELAQQRNIGWWATSALESNVGLFAIANWIQTKNITLPQGLGTGGLYSNNIPSPLKIENSRLIKSEALNWNWTSIF
jgi:O-succinylbenzoate synthase